jgi:hypothetical protein
VSTAATGKPGTLIPASKKLDAPSKRLLRIVTVCSTSDEFVSLFGELVDDTSIYIVTRHPLPVGTRRLVRVQLASGEPVMRADGEIITAHTNNDGPGGQNGMRVKLLTMDERTHAIHKKLLVRAAIIARQQAMPPPIPPPASPRQPVAASTLAAAPAPVAAPTPVSPPPPVAVRPLPGMTSPPPKTTAAYPFATALPGVTPAAALPGVTPPPVRVDPDRPVVPANPFAELHPSALEHFVECTLYEETAPHDLREIDAQIQKEKEKEQELEKGFGAAVDETRGVGKLKRVPSAVWSGLLAAVIGIGAGWLMRGSPPSAPPPPKPAPAAVAEAPKPAAETANPAAVAEAPKPGAEAPRPEPPKSPPGKCTASIASLPPGADVTWGAAALGKTPLEDVAVPCGEAVVKVDTGKSAPRELHVAAEADHPPQLVVPFGKFAAQLELRSKPPGAVFSVDGAIAGPAPTDATVAVGRRVRVTATLAGHKPWALKVLVKKKKQFVAAQLSPE